MTDLLLVLMAACAAVSIIALGVVVEEMHAHRRSRRELRQRGIYPAPRDGR